MLLLANEHPKVVSERLGHASVTITLNIYSHVLPTMQVAATQQIAKLLFAEEDKRAEEAPTESGEEPKADDANPHTIGTHPAKTPKEEEIAEG